ncbi:MAG: hypothetical protein AVDCRST_MAG06-994, partial [uncultured Nocardioides sp.]
GGAAARVRGDRPVGVQHRRAEGAGQPAVRRGRDLGRGPRHDAAGGVAAGGGVLRPRAGGRQEEARQGRELAPQGRHLRRGGVQRLHRRAAVRRRWRRRRGHPDSEGDEPSRRPGAGRPRRPRRHRVRRVHRLARLEREVPGAPGRPGQDRSRRPRLPDLRQGRLPRQGRRGGRRGRPLRLRRPHARRRRGRWPRRGAAHRARAAVRPVPPGRDRAGHRLLRVVLLRPRAPPRPL